MLVFVSNLDQSTVNVSLFQEQSEHSSPIQKTVNNYGPQSVKFHIDIYKRDDSKLLFPPDDSRYHDILRHIRNPKTWKKPFLANWSCVGK